MSETVESTDVVIVGAGPVGLFAVFELGMLKIRAHVVDSLDVIGGQCQALYPEKPIYDIPGYPRIQAGELVRRLEEQAEPFQPRYHLGQRVEKLTPREGGRWLVETSAGTRIECAGVVIAAGVGAFGPNRPPLAGIEAYEGRGPGVGVHYMVGRREDFRGKRVVIAGGGDSALDWTLSLAEFAEKVYVVHRRNKFRAAPESVSRMRALAEAPESGVELVIPYQLHGLEGRDGNLDAVIVSTLDGETRRLQADALLPFFGLSMNLGPIAEWGLRLERDLITVDPATCATSTAGIYAIGDIATYPNKLKLILCGFSEAAMAAHDIFSRVYPDEVLHWEYSTTKGVPG
ncbi:NAD(P)/FAD-dependent oxidoreductase [Ferruginivarius sediminum]|uniref:Ferredoxin--NADP reductase n=1 Tax=Ferruginivarius sediminum TaxID=2661937 RepID=A0A369T4Y0_9PROT|nr:NAD(P)/FAD-dependent oxidoreductase [Ferruginivarius sediminum]RDD60401.1 NAD(P)/FAD-dependent oxidoreductase [Ferruginivarius sediminum]